MKQVNYDKIIFNPTVEKCRIVDVSKYKKQAKLVNSSNWNTVIKFFYSEMKKSRGINRGPLKLSYLELKSKLSDIALDSGMGHIKGTTAIYHGLLYRLISENQFWNLHEIRSKINRTYWIIDHNA